MDFQENSSSQDIYDVLNKDVEICNDYFDVVPDGNLYTMDDMPIFAIRMRPKGIQHIIEFYKKKYNFHTSVLTYKINTNQYTLYSDNTAQIYNTQKKAILKYFDFSQCKDGDFRGIIIVVTNDHDRMVHAIPYIYGICNGKKKIIFLDPFFKPDLNSGSIIGANFFYKEYNGDIDCYCHGQLIQADHHSCGIIACDFIKNCLRNNAEITEKILENTKMRLAISDNDEKKFYVNIYTLPSELSKFAQIKHNKTAENIILEAKNEIEKEKRHQWFSGHIRTLIYRKNKNPYNPADNVIPTQIGEKKSINTSLLEKGHKYAGRIIKDLDQKTAYNSKYWLLLIREQKEGNIISNIIRRARKTVRQMLSNQN